MLAPCRLVVDCRCPSGSIRVVSERAGRRVASTEDAWPLCVSIWAFQAKSLSMEFEITLVGEEYCTILFAAITAQWRSSTRTLGRVLRVDMPVRTMPWPFALVQRHQAPRKKAHEGVTCMVPAAGGDDVLE